MIKRRLTLLLAFASLCAASALQSQTQQTADPHVFSDTFRFVVLPDTQKYVKSSGPGTLGMFNWQTSFVRNHYVDLNIKYVAHVGDIVEHGDYLSDLTQSNASCTTSTPNNNRTEWSNALSALSKLDEDPNNPTNTPAIQYGVAVGNHDTSPINGGPYQTNPGVPDPNNPGQYLYGPTTNSCFDLFFPPGKFNGRAGAGYGNFDSKNLNHFDLVDIDANNKYVFIYVQYDDDGCKPDDETCIDPCSNPPSQPCYVPIGSKNNQGPKEQSYQPIYDWVQQTLDTYASSRKVVIVTHYVGSTGNPTTLGAQALRLFDMIKDYPNAVMMLGGHVSGAYNGSGRRQDITSTLTSTTYQGDMISSLISDYQADEYITGHHTDANGNRVTDSVADGGNGFLREYAISPSNNTITAITYSPYIHGTTNPPPTTDTKTNPRDAFQIQMKWKSRADVIWRDSSNVLKRIYWDNSGTGQWVSSDPTASGSSISGVMSNPTAISRGNHLLDVFYADANNNLHWAFFDGDQWTVRVVRDVNNHVIDLGGSVPTAVALGLYSMKVMYQGTGTNANALMTTEWDGSSWSAPEARTATVYTTPASVAWGPRQLENLYLDSTGSTPAVRRKMWVEYNDEDGGIWKQEQTLASAGLPPLPSGLNFKNKVAVDSVSSGKLTLVVWATDNNLYALNYSQSYPSGRQDGDRPTDNFPPATPNPWVKITSTADVDGGPTSVSWGPNRHDVVYKNTSGKIGHLFYDGTGTTGWHSDTFPGLTGGAPSTNGGPTITSWSHFF